MKKRPSKWLKWNIGALGLLGLVVLFQEVKDSPAFEHAYANASPLKEQSTGQQKSRDPVIGEWQQSQASGSGGRQGASAHRHRQNGTSTDLNGGSADNGSMNTSPGDSSSAVPSTRTGRS